MTVFEIISIFIGILALLISFGSLIVALPAFLDKRNNKPLIVVGSFQQRTGCTHCKSYITASDR